mmetsp:Transcript_44643/g.131791  ORF Transcript_44643/g.131791 Transcript_44643/m.131791 type:complete len:94 (-) Transcript_44643:430-711(-)
MVNGAAASAAGSRAQRRGAKFRASGTPTTHATIILSHVRQDVRLTASKFLSDIAVEKFVVEVGWRAIQRRTRSELLPFYFTFTGLANRRAIFW